MLPSLKEPLLGALSSCMTFVLPSLTERILGALSSCMTFVLPSLKEPLLGALSSCMTFVLPSLTERILGALSSCMTFLDLTEGDKLAFLVVGLHVGPMHAGGAAMPECGWLRKREYSK